MRSFSKFQKIISSLLVLAFINLNLFAYLPEAKACQWWGNSQGFDTTNISEEPLEENSFQDGKDCQEECCEPVFIHNGDFVYEHQDVFIPARSLDIEINRTYKSQSNFNSRFGFGWDNSYNERIVELANGDIYYFNGKLQRLQFIYVPESPYISPKGVFDKLVQNEDGTFTLTDPHGLKKIFDQNGCLTQIIDRNNNTMAFNYDPAGLLPIIGIPEYSDNQTPRVIAYDYKLISITDTVGRQITFEYNDDGRLIKIRDFSGREWHYAYGPSHNGDLISATTPATLEYSNGNTTTYAYENHNLTIITDAKGQTYLTNHYDLEDRVASQNYGSGTFHFSYDETNRKTTITNPKGFITEWTYDENGLVLSKKEFTADLRTSDPDFFLTTYAYNFALERTNVNYPKGNSIQYTYDNAYENLLAWEFNTDGNTEGWAPANCLNSFIVLGGTLRANVVCNDPFMLSPNIDIAADISQSIQIRYKINAGTTAQVYWRTATGGWSEARHMDFAITADNQFHTYVLDVGSHPEWVGAIKQIRFDPSTSSPGNVEIDYIRISAPTWQGKGNLTEVRRKADASQPDNDENDIVTAFTYEPNFNFIQTVTDPKGKVTTFNYDGRGNLALITYPEVAGQIPRASFTYNQFGQIETATDPNNNLTRYEYFTDSGYLQKIIQDPAGINAITEFTYDAYGNVASVKDANNRVATFEHNALNQLTKQIAPAPFNYQTKYSYDANANLTKVERQANPQATYWQKTEYAYSPLDQLELIKQYLTPTAFLSTAFTYDLNGNRASITDSGNKTTTYQYDERDLIWKTTDALNNTTEYAYDLNANLVNIKDAKTQETNYAYDNFDRLQTTSYADASSEQYTYDKNSNLVELRTPNSELITYSYDALNRLDLKTYPDQSTVDYTYDLGSRLTSMVYGLSSMVYTYDALNRITQSTQTLNPLNPLILSYEYDKVGNRTRLLYPSNKDIRYAYDELNRVSSIQHPGSSIVNYSYDVLSRRTQHAYANGSKADYAYDNANRLIQVSNYKPPSQNPPADKLSSNGFRQGQRSPLHKAGGQAYRLWATLFGKKAVALTDSRNGHPDRSPNPQTALVTLNDFLNPFSTPEAEAIGEISVPPGTFSYFNYTYDAAGNRTLLRAQQAQQAQQTQETYQYDSIYQLTGVAGNQTHNYQYDQVGNRQVADSVTYSANNLNQYTVVGAQNYTYDANGNLTNDGTNTYAYDVENRLTSIEHPGSSIQYQYDGFGRRISKTVDGNTTYFIYDADQIIEERGAAGNLLASYIYGTGIDEVVRMDRGWSYYYHYDGLGSVTDLTDANGNVVESYSYDVYGMPSQPSDVGNPYMFTGRNYDVETGLYYYRTRDYSLVIGRFLQRDSIGYYDNLNLYSYTNNNPTNFVDPYGLWGIQFGDFNIGYGNPTFLFNQGSTEYFQQSLYATANGFIPFVDPFQGKYSKCDKGLQWSERLGALSRDLFLMALANPSLPFKISVPGVAEPTHIGLDLWGRNIIHYGRHVKFGRHIGILFKEGGAWIHRYWSRWFIS